MLTKIITWIDKNKTVLLLTLLISFLLFGGIGSCGSAKIERKLGSLEESVRIHAEETKFLRIEITTLEKSNTKLLLKNEELFTQIKKNEKDLKAGFDRIAHLEANRPDAPPECTEIVNYMQGEINEWKAQFSLAIKDRDDWKARSGNFELAYTQQVAITGKLQIVLDSCTEDSLKKDIIIKDLQKSLKWNMFKSTTTKVVVAIVGGVIIYSLVRK